MEPHATRVVVWDTPSAIECGASFRVTVGVKCAAAECGAAAWRVEIRDGTGRAVAVAAVGDVPWPGTALYPAEIELRAPESEGVEAWEASVPAVFDATGRCTHAAASVSFRVHTVPAPECVLTVVAVDARSSAPVPGAKVVVHPYRAVTNSLGVAQIRVPRGAYRLFVSGRDRFPFRSDGEISADATVRAELDPDLGLSDAELWA